MVPPPDDRPPHGDSGDPDGRPPVSATDTQPNPRDGVVPAARWIVTTDYGPVQFTRELVSSILLVAILAGLLFAVSGVWPPMVAVESGSMEPHMYRGDLIVLMEEHRFAPEIAQPETGIVTYRGARAAGYTRFGDYGDVIVFETPNPERSAIIHRARFYVEDGENWYQEANDAYLPPGVSSCNDIRYCPADRSGFITKGDANRYYDQANRISPVVGPSAVRGTAEIRIPWLGHIRLWASRILAVA